MLKKEAGVCFILLPGFSPDDFTVQNLKRCLEKRGCHAVASNFYGNAVVKDFSKVKVADCLENISEIIKEAKKNHDKVIGVGISLGGAFLLEHAKREKNLDAIISIGTPFRLKNVFLIKLGQKILLPVVSPFWKMAEKIKKLRLPPITATKVITDYLRKEFILNLENITVPILFVHSKKDRITDFRVLEEFSNKIPSLNKKMIILDNGDHVINGGSEKICEYIFDFIEPEQLIHPVE
ncbi:MAG: hypothetical protein NTZ97_01880 [Candidatus Moranbacteria bacterium]|nr:hypothetical protein [Candidatus Moranbacteria bacterium]